MTVLVFTATINFSYAADSLPIKPGLWEVTGTTSSPLFGSRTHTNQECMKEFKFDPKEMMEGMPKDACQVNTNLSGNTMTYDMSCDLGGEKMTGSGKFTVSDDGNTGKGEMVMKSQVQGQNIEMTMMSEGKRIGDC